MDRLPKEHPILFSAPMVKAILAGTKTQTRRVVKPGPSQEWLTPKTIDMVRRWANGGSSEWWTMAVGDESRIVHCGHEMDGGHIGSVRCPYGAPGDRLWVRETWQAIHVYVDPETGRGDGLMWAADIPKDSQDGFWGVAYAATDLEANAHPDDRGFSWRPSIHMPRWASRITLEITEVRVQRVAEISEEDALAEGVEPCAGSGGPCRVTDQDEPLRCGFASLWQSINGKRGFGWQANPWVWALTFRRVPQNGERDRRMAGVQATHDASQEPR